MITISHVVSNFYSFILSYFCMDRLMTKYLFYKKLLIREISSFKNLGKYRRSVEWQGKFKEWFKTILFFRDIVFMM